MRGFDVDLWGADTTVIPTPYLAIHAKNLIPGREAPASKFSIHVMTANESVAENEGSLGVPLPIDMIETQKGELIYVAAGAFDHAVLAVG